jgi:hypothetical protein
MENMADVSPNDKSENFADAKELQVEFDRQAGVNYLTCDYCWKTPLCCFGICCPFTICAPYFARKDMDNQKCKINESEIYYKSGSLIKITRGIPLDRVQDVSISQGRAQKYFGVYQLDVQTASFPCADYNTAVFKLIAPKDPEMVRDFIMTKRGARVNGPRPGVASSILSSLGTDSQAEVEKLKVEVARLEAEKAQREIDALRAQVAKLEAEKQQKK